MQLEHGLVGGSRGVEGDPATHRGLRGCPSLRVGPDDGQHRQAHGEAVEAAARGTQRRDGALAQVGLGGEAVTQQAIGNPACHGGHAVPHRGEHDVWRAVWVGSGVEEVGHQRVLVVGAAEGQAGTGIPAAPDGSDRRDELLHPLGWVAPGHAEPAFDVRSHLRAQP